MFKVGQSLRARSTRSVLLATVVLAPMLGMASAQSAAAHAPTVADIARSQVGNNCTPYYGCIYPRAWCAEFARWVWKQAGANTSGLNAAAASFYSYGQKNGTLHTSNPQVGDAVLWDDDGSVSGEANHVSLVVAVSSDGSQIQTVGGNESGKVSAKGWFNWRTYTNPGAGKALAFISPNGVPGTPPTTPTPPASPAQWRAQFAVESGGSVFHGVRNADRTWTGFGNVESDGGAGEIPSGVQDVAEAGINGDTHVLAVSNDGKLYHSMRFADRTWAGFGNVHEEAGVVGNVTQVDAVSVGAELHVAVVADGVVRHTVRHADGSWQPFGTVGKPGEAPVTKVALARTGDEVQLVAVAGGVVHHKLRKADASWTGWGVPSTAAGLTGVGDVAIAGTGGDLQLIVTASNGTKQYHGVRYANGTWTSFNSLTSVISGVTVTDVAAAAVDGELQVGLVATDGRILHTIRHANATWDNPGSIDLTGVTGDHTGIALTGTYN